MSKNKNVQQLIYHTASLALILLVVGCSFRVARYVPEGRYLLKDNRVTIKGESLDESEVKRVIRQQPNLKAIKFLNLKLRLVAFNSIRPEKAEKSRLKRLAKFRNKNTKRLLKQDRINERKMQKAKKKGKTTYFERTLQLKDTITPRLTIRERIKYKFGEAPVIADSFLFEKSKEQLQVYLHQKGYYYDTVTAVMDTLKNRKKQKIIANYTLVTGPRYYIDSFNVVSSNGEVTGAFSKFLKKIRDKNDFNEHFYEFRKNQKAFRIPFDKDRLNEYRFVIAKFMRDESLYGFSAQHISYIADTNKADMSVSLNIVFSDRLVEKPEYPDSLVPVRHTSTIVKGVYFHICDTTLFEGNFKDVANSLSLQLKSNDFLPTLDTFFYNVLYRKVENKDDGDDKKTTYFKSEVATNLFGKPKDSVELNPFRMATFVYNGDLFVQAGLLEAQNYLEFTNYYKEYYFDRTYNRLLQLGLFSVIKPEIIEIPGTGEVEVHYYLVPAKKQSYSFEPRATNSNGFLGVSAAVNYANKNLFKAGWLTTITLSGGFESQPPVFDETIDGQKIQKSGRSFNTFEIGPTLKFDLPGFFPINIAKLAKRSRPRTILSTAYNYQRRPDFSRGVFQLNFLWKMYIGKTQIVSLGVPGASVIKFVALKKTPEFQARIDKLNDLFLRNAYSDQLIWEDFKFIFDYDNLEREKKVSEKLRFTFNNTLNSAGFILSGGRAYQDVDTNGRRQLFGVAYSQFVLVDTKTIAYYTFSRKRVLALRTLAGIGKPYGNTKTSLPYDYSFFAGGANDNRGFVARALGPGAYKYYLDTNRTATQIGDIRLGASLEFRVGGGFFKSAFFLDVGNIWTIEEDPNRIGSRISKNWYKELGLAVGYGLRLDFDFFVVRFDLGFPLTNPALSEGSRWVFQTRKHYLEEINQLSDLQKGKLSAPFQPKLNIGIGFPF